MSEGLSALGAEIREEVEVGEGWGGKRRDESGKGGGWRADVGMDDTSPCRNGLRVRTYE